jgi:hypothetical protein
MEPQGTAILMRRIGDLQADQHVTAMERANKFQNARGPSHCGICD